MTRLKLQFDMLGGNVRIMGRPLILDLDVDTMNEHEWTVMSLKKAWEELLQGHKDSLGIAQEDEWKFTAAQMVWHIGEQLLMGFRNLQDYLPRPLPDIVTISWTVRSCFQTIMSQICTPSNRGPCQLGRQGENQYLWFLSGEPGLWVVFGQYVGQWSWEEWPIESAKMNHGGHHFGGMLLHASEFAFEALDEELQMTIVSQNVIHNYQAMPDQCKDNEWLAYHAAMIDGRVLQHLKPQFQADRAIVQEAVRQCPEAMQWAAEHLQPDLEQYQ